MKSADDRLRNTLVIDEDGLARVITEANERLYPVCTEPWEAANKYVGRYSALSDARPAYVRALKGWLRYLSTGKQQYVDYAEDDNEEELIMKIKKYY